MSTQWSNALRQSFRRPTFLVVLLVLLVGAIGINAATTAMKLHFRKEALPLRAKTGLGDLPDQIGSWVRVPEPQTVNPDLEHSLGTDKYVFRTYVDVSATGTDGDVVAKREDVLAMEKLSPDERHGKLQAIRQKNTSAVLNVAVTYYTGKVDTVPHVPDRCYVADGFQPTAYEVKQWDLGEVAPGVVRRVPVRFIDFEDQTERGQQNRCVTYFFHANGKYSDSPLEVRRMLQDLFQKYGYFAKVEIMSLLPSRPGTIGKDPLRERDRREAAGAIQRFLTSGLPEVEKLLPDWDNLPR
jgi:hypothetical protein